MTSSRTTPSGPTPVGPPLQETDPLTRDDVLDLARCRNGAQMQAAYAGRDAGSNSGQMVSTASGPEATPSFATHPSVEKVDPLNTEDVLALSADVGPEGREAAPSFATHPPVEETYPPNTEDVLALSTEYAIHYSSNSNTTDQISPIEEEDPLNTGDVLDLSGDRCTSDWPAAIASFHPDTTEHTITISPVEEEDPLNTGDVVDLSGPSHASDVTCYPSEETDIFNREDVIDLNQSCPDEEVCVRSSGLEELVNATLDAQTSSAANPVPENPPNQPVEETPDMEADDVNLARYRPRVRGGERANARGRIPLEYVQGLGDAPLEHVIDDAEMGLLKIRQCSSSSEERDHRC